jgi:DNA primase large subunit
VSKGRVYLDRETYTRVLEEAIYQHVLKTFETLEPLRVDQKLLEEARKIAQVREAASSDIASEQGVQVVKEDAFPPCVKRAIERLRQGENISHAERFLIATFLLNIGLEVDQVVELFRSAPDFNEKITRYQVEHLAGLRGGRKKYSPYSCDKLKALGLCPVLDRCDGRNPLSVYYRNLRRGGTGTLKIPGDLVREEVGSVDEEGDHQGGEDEVSDISAHGESYTTS